LSIFIHVLALLLHYTWTTVWWTSSNNQSTFFSTVGIYYGPGIYFILSYFDMSQN